MAYGISSEARTVFTDVDTFDAAFAAGAIPVTDAFACSTTGLNRLMKDLSGEAMDTPQFIEVLAADEPSRKWWHLRQTGRVFADHASETIRLNRVFGQAIGLEDTLWTEYPDFAKHHSSIGDPYGIFTVNLADDPSSTRSEFTLRHHGYGMLEMHIGREKLERLGALAAKRCGVQVIYGGEGFPEYMKDAERDYNHETAFEMPRRIPPEFMKYILPLGEYEQAQLLSHTSS